MKFIFVWALAAGLALSPAGRAAEPAIIAKARAYVGPEAALNALNSIHMQGTMVMSAGDGSAPTAPAQIDIIFQKPWQECVTVVTPDLITQTALDGYDGWHLEQRRAPGDPAAVDMRRPSQLTILDPERIKGLRTDVWENMAYYRGLEDIGGRTEDQGPATIDGVACEKVALIHSPDVVYTRYFDLATGRLVYSQTLKGAKIRERGEIKAGGLRFPQTIEVVETVDGKDHTTTLTLDRVTVNEVFPEQTFGVPLPPLPLHELNPGGPNQPAPAPGPAAPGAP